MGGMTCSGRVLVIPLPLTTLHQHYFSVAAPPEVNAVFIVSIVKNIMDPPETDKSTKSSNLSFVVPSSFLQRSASSDTDSFDAGFRFALAARPKGAALDSVSKFRQANVAGTKKLSSGPHS